MIWKIGVLALFMMAFLGCGGGGGDSDPAPVATASSSSPAVSSAAVSSQAAKGPCFPGMDCY